VERFRQKAMGKDGGNLFRTESRQRFVAIWKLPGINVKKWFGNWAEGTPRSTVKKVLNVPLP